MYEVKELLRDLGVEITPNNLSMVLSKYNVFKKDEKNPMEYVADYVCFINGITLEKFKSKARFQNIIIARREFMYILHSLGYQLVTIASFLNCNHSTIVHHIQDVNDKFSINPKEKRNFMEKYVNIFNNQIVKDFAFDASIKYKYFDKSKFRMNLNN